MADNETITLFNISVTSDDMADRLWELCEWMTEGTHELDRMPTDDEFDAMLKTVIGNATMVEENGRIAFDNFLFDHFDKKTREIIHEIFVGATDEYMKPTVLKMLNTKED